MPALIAALWTGFLAVLTSAAGQVVVALGMGVVTYTGVDTSLTFFKTMAIQHLAALPPTVYQLLGYMKVGVCVSMIMSATVMRLTIGGLKSGVIKRWQVNH